MSVEGKWIVTIKGPTGPMATTLTLEQVDGALAGTQAGQGMSSPITGAKLEGSTLSWINNVTKPMKLKLEFSGVVDGPKIDGKVKVGFMGSFPFSGVKE
jgi:hypothetical protein